MFKKFKEFFSAESYEQDAYGYLTNQIGHVVLGCYCVTLAVGLPYVFFLDTYPSQVPFVMACMFAYVVIWEFGIQGYKGLDTLEDSLYFSLGTSLWLFIDMIDVIERLLGWSLAFTVLLGIGVLRRLPK
jgi:hypothetical protein